MPNGEDFFLRMCKEAQEELASGQKGWKEVDTNTLFLACFGMLYNHLTHRFLRPMWFFATSVFMAVVGYLISLAINSGAL